MCGIVGILKNTEGEIDAERLKRAVHQLSHRGPDAQRIWVGRGVALGHSRLSIVDLSPAGNQPMRSQCGRWMLSFNGEIYNHLEIRRDLSRVWRGHSDTETLVESISEWGPREALQRCRGMFAWIVWDNNHQQLTLARDRMGEKPLYYGMFNGEFRAASELRSLIAADEKLKLDHQSLALYLRHSAVPAPYSIWEGVRKVPPGHLVQVDQVPDIRVREPIAWWRLEEVTDNTSPISSATLAVEGLHDLLKAAVREQMISDVPLGAFLSGGIDSSTIVALMQSQSARPVRTFTIGFAEKQHNESSRASAIARHLGTEHTTLVVSSQDALATIPDLPDVWDEPFADSSQIPTLLLSRLTRKSVTVSLSGDGGDELFCGYDRYSWFARLDGTRRLIPQGARDLIARSLHAAGTNRSLGILERAAASRGLTFSLTGHRLQRLAELMRVDSSDALYRDLVSGWVSPSEILGPILEPPTVLTHHLRGPASPPRRLQFFDQLSYLPDDILTKVDRASMSVGLEARIPLLDPRVIELSWRMPSSMHRRRGQTKWVLRQVLARYVPPALFEQPKHGFSVPLDEWLRGPLRDWASDLLSKGSLSGHGLFDSTVVQRVWNEHLSGRRNHKAQLWSILMFQAWYDKWARA